ncbi:uncharacterized protein LOC110045350 [Orbicella faveolata]|uniref:uncharacterized protein LOC110045350 n=1 Tax=Orbicella faveolata TaxID=48498 RepID=UPI0009E6187C|nr:uncharacterized protein LOC110045350 [Orbicella faveolata]
MHGHRLLAFLLFQRMINFCYLAVAEDLTWSRSAYFTTHENQRLEGHVVEQFESPSSISCSYSCLRNPWCTSTNFNVLSGKNDRGTCELNKHGVLDENSEFHEKDGVTFSLIQKGCLITGCHNGGVCVADEMKQTFSCLCQVPWAGAKCDIKIDASSCDEAQMKVNRMLQNGEYLLTIGSLSLKVYCHMTDDGKGWTLIARFSNSDIRRWMFDSGRFWCFKINALGNTTSPSINADMISTAFWYRKLRQFSATIHDISV